MTAAAAASSSRSINFFPRNKLGKRITGSVPHNEGAFLQGKLPDMLPAPDRVAPPITTDSVMALVHGIGITHIPSAFEKGYLSSAYMREGPSGRYSRDADKTGGGGLAVYTRAVGTKHKAWPATGQGVGSGDSKAQIILKPAILTSHPAWRHSDTDLMGTAPGVTKVMLADKGLDSFDLWQLQSENARNRAFNSAMDHGSGLANNEQMFWEQIPLHYNVQAIVCQSEDNRKQLIESMKGNMAKSCITHGGKQIPVVVGAGVTLSNVLKGVDSPDQASSSS